jgi:tetratricopeptide (TPR) repeat protein
MAGTLNSAAYAELQEGRRRMNFPVTQEDLSAAAQHFRTAIELDSGLSFNDAREKANIDERGYPKAWGHLGYNVLATWVEGWSSPKERPDVMAEADEYTANAVGQARGVLDYDTHWDRAFYLQMRGPDDDTFFDLAITEYQAAIDLNIVDMNLLLEASEAYVSAGQPDEAIKLVRRAGRHICHDWYRWDLAWAYYFKARLGGPIFYWLAIDELRKMRYSPGEPRYMIDVQLLAAACYVRLEKQDMADVAFNLFSQGKDVWTLADEDRARPFRFEADRLHLLEACKMAGLADPTGLLP